MTTWIRSGRCSDGSCLRAAHVDGHIHVRDEHGHTIALTVETWATVVDGIHAGHTNPLPHTICIGLSEVSWTGVRPDDPNRLATLRYTCGEWDAFLDGVRNGDFDTINA